MVEKNYITYSSYLNVVDCFPGKLNEQHYVYGFLGLLVFVNLLLGFLASWYKLKVPGLSGIATQSASLVKGEKCPPKKAKTVG